MLVHDTTCRVGAMYPSWHVCIMVVGHAFEQLHRALHCAGSRRTSCTTRGRRCCVLDVVVAIVVAVALCCRGHRCRVIVVAVAVRLQLRLCCHCRSCCRGRRWRCHSHPGRVIVVAFVVLWARGSRVEQVWKPRPEDGCDRRTCLALPVTSPTAQRPSNCSDTQRRH